MTELNEVLMTSTKDDPKMVFAENLERARKRLGKSQDQLAKDVGLSRQAIFKYEKAEVSPSMDAVFKLAAALKVDVEYFFQKKSEQEDFHRWLDIIDVSPCDPFTNVCYRDKQNLTTELTEKIKSETYHQLIKLLAVEKITDNQIDFRNPIENLRIQTRQDAEKAALEVRKKWQLYDNAVANVIDLLETKGVRVIEINAIENFQGFSAKYGDLPIIVLNFKVQEVTRKRFTAFHELGHLILQIQDGIDHEAIEKICDTFAATMLLPKQLLILEFGATRNAINPNEILRLKGKYGISVHAILVGAFFAKIISWEEHERLLKEISNKASAASKFHILEKPTRFKQLLSQAQAEGLVDDRRAKSLAKGEITNEVSSNLITASL